MKNYKTTMLLGIFLVLFTAITFAQNVPNLQEAQKIDGRFCLGAGQKAFLFGYPFSYSTSHFVMYADGRIASNNAEFRNCTTLKGTYHQSNQYGSVFSEVCYHFANITIIQRLIPLDAQRKEIPINQFGKFYKVEYTFKNLSDIEKKISFSTILDIMANGNDGILPRTTTAPLKINTEYQGKDIPTILYIGEKNTDSYQLSFQEKSLPSALFLSQWTFLNNVLDYRTITPPAFSDDAALKIDWRNQSIKAKDSLKIAYYIGSENINEIQAQHRQLLSEEKSMVFFEKAQAELSDEGIAAIAKLIGNKRVKAALIEGYTDADGENKDNLLLAQKRIENVSMQLQMNGVHITKIIKKAHGEFFADETAPTGSLKQSNERKVVITIWK